MKKLTRKEMLFCLHYAEDRNGRIAAAKAGYASPLHSAVRLLRRAEILQTIAENTPSPLSTADEVLLGYRKLAFGSGADALRLLFSGSPSEIDFDALDLFNIAEIKKPKDGALVIKFFDRLKALEHLQTACEQTADSSALPFLQALMQSVPQSEEEEQEEEIHHCAI